MTHVAGGAYAPEVDVTASGRQSDMLWLLRHFATDVPGVTHAVLLSRGGLRLLDSEVDKDWADELSAALSGVAALALNMTGPSGQKQPGRQVVIEREDCLSSSRVPVRVRPSKTTPATGAV